MKEKEEALDITPELALSAYNVMRKYCWGRGGKCKGCAFNGEENACDEMTGHIPEDWPDIRR